MVLLEYDNAQLYPQLHSADLAAWGSLITLEAAFHPLMQSVSWSSVAAKSVSSMIGRSFTVVEPNIVLLNVFSGWIAQITSWEYEAPFTMASQYTKQPGMHGLMPFAKITPV